MTKKRAMIIAGMCLALLMVGLVALPFCGAYIDYRENKKKVLEYVETHYDIEWELVDTTMGKNAWPAGRQRDKFVFKDITNDFYFVIDCVNEYLHDEYVYAYEGKKVSNVVEENFPKMNMNIIFGVGEKSSSQRKNLT